MFITLTIILSLGTTIPGFYKKIVKKKKHLLSLRNSNWGRSADAHSW